MLLVSSETCLLCPEGQTGCDLAVYAQHSWPVCAKNTWWCIKVAALSQANLGLLCGLAYMVATQAHLGGVMTQGVHIKPIVLLCDCSVMSLLATCPQCLTAGSGQVAIDIHQSL
jgi:hypothetical protein